MSPRHADGRRGRLGPHIGPVRITPIRVIFVVALLGSLAYIAWAILKVRDSEQIPMVASGLAVLAIIFAALSIGGAIRMWQAWRDGSQGQTLLFALLGGIAGMIAIGCVSATLVLALVMGA